MPIIPELPHIKVNGHATPETYRYPRTVVVEFPIAARNRAIHGNRILEQLEQLRQRFEQLENQPLPDNIVSDDAIYVEFVSEWNFPLSFSSIHSDANRPKYQIIKVTKEIQDEADGNERYRTLVMLTKGGVSYFINHVTAYIDPERDVAKMDEEGNVIETNPKYNKLFANLDLIQAATLREFWSDGLLQDFPDDAEERWWEVWFRRTTNDDDRIARVAQNLQAIGAQLGQSEIRFPEHIVKLVRATANQLSSSLLLLDNLAELRNPQETADCFTREGLTGREAWVQDLIDRTENQVDDNSVLICLLDSGVNNRHPLLTPFLPNDRLHAYNPEWGNHDSWIGEGHGTGMAGLALYGDLTDAFASRERIVITHGLESFKIKQYGVDNDPELYGIITLNSVNQPVITHPNRRVFCLSITDADFAFKGRPSSWSAMIDRIAFGNTAEAAPPQLFLISSGNVVTNQQGDYTDLNDTSSIHDPGQAYNALTVGTYTMKDRLNVEELPGWQLLAPRGSMSPSNSTSLLWEGQWPIKPDIVMEGGNMATDQTDVVHAPELQLISTSKRHQDNVLQFFGDTSGAAALASKLAAEITTAYPQYWPETIRGLIAHSAEYSAQMLGNGRHFPATAHEKRTLLRRYGHGVPNLDRALYSASNCLHMVMERTIQPFQQIGTNAPKYHQYHLFQLPWPADILRNELAEANVRLKITLSYFIEPNPGDRRYVNNFQYHSHSLDFMLIKPAEDLDTFKLRVSKAAEEDETDENVNREGEVWTLKSARNRGSLKKDFVATSGADLSTRHVLAVYPKNGWYRTRKKLGLANSEVRYSLIVSIETENTEVNIYNTVAQMVAVPI